MFKLVYSSVLFSNYFNDEPQTFNLKKQYFSTWNTKQLLSFIYYKSTSKVFSKKISDKVINEMAITGFNGFDVQQFFKITDDQRISHLLSLFPNLNSNHDEFLLDFEIISSILCCEFFMYSKTNENDITTTLDEIFPSINNPYSILTHSIQSNFIDSIFPIFVDRIDFEKDVIQFGKLIKNYYNNTFILNNNNNNNNTISTRLKQFNFGCIFNGAGSGKTRASKEVLNILKNEFPNEMFISTYMDFMQGSGGLTSNEKECLRNDNHASRIIGYRILHSLNLHTLDLLDKYRLCTCMELSNVLLWISNILKLKQNEKILNIILIMDEFQDVMESCPNGWKSICSEIILNMNENVINNNNICLIPIISGTMLFKDFNFYNIYPLQLNPISQLGSTRMIENYFTNKQIMFQQSLDNDMSSNNNEDNFYYSAETLLSHEMTNLFFATLGPLPKVLYLSLKGLTEFFSNQKQSDWEKSNSHNMLSKMLQVLEESKNEHLLLKYTHELNSDLFNIVYNAIQYHEDVNQCNIPLTTLYCNYYHFQDLIRKYVVIKQSFASVDEMLQINQIFMNIPNLFKETNGDDNKRKRNDDLSIQIIESSTTTIEPLNKKTKN